MVISLPMGSWVSELFHEDPKKGQSAVTEDLAPSHAGTPEAAARSVLGRIVASVDHLPVHFEWTRECLAQILL